MGFERAKILRKEVFKYYMEFDDWENTKQKVLNPEPIIDRAVEGLSSTDENTKLMTDDAPDIRQFIIDSGASLHFVGKAHISLAEWANAKRLLTPQILRTANGKVSSTYTVRLYVKAFSCSRRSPRCLVHWKLIT